MQLLKDHSFHVASYGTGAAFAAWFLEGLGAHVTHESKLEADGAGCWLAEHATRSEAPCLEGAPGVTVITDAPVSAKTRGELEELAASRRVIWLTPWGLDNDFEDAPATDMILQAAGGWMHAAGDADREPLSAPGKMVDYIGGQFAVVEALALKVTSPGPEAGLTVISLAECALATTIYDMITFQYSGQIRKRSGPRYNPRQPTITTLACKDGYIGLHAALHRQWLRLCQLIGHPELVSDPRFADPEARAKNVEQLDPYILRWLAGRTREEAYHAIQGAGIPASLHPTLDEVLASPQLAARDAWTTVVHPSGKTVTVPRPPFREMSISVGGAAAEPGDGVWKGTGPRVLDISMGWAGPMVSHVLSYYGADVIKVEGPERFDWWRGSRPPGDDPSLQLHERSHVFNGVNRGKRGVTIDLATDEGRTQLLELVRGAEILVENFSINVVEKLGISFEELIDVNPGLVMVRLPAFGGGGPESEYSAFGNTFEGMTGLSAMMGYPGGPPAMTSVALADPINGLNGAMVGLAAMLARVVDGQGRLVEVSQLEGFLPVVGEDLIRFQVSGEHPVPKGNRRPGSEPSGVLPCAGDDQWVAFEVRTDAEWARLQPYLNTGLGITDTASSLDRASQYERIMEALTAWSAEQTRPDALEKLRGAGVVCAPVNSPADLLGAEPFVSDEFFEGVDRDVVGFHLYPGLPIRRGTERPRAVLPAPMLGEHNAEILGAPGAK